MNRTPLVLILTVAAACRRAPPARRPAPPTASPVAAPATARAPSGAPPAASIDPPAGPEAFRETSRFLPQGAAVPGWTQSGSVRLASASELFQIMDGAAEKYVGYGVRQFARTEYRKTGTQLVVSAEVYDMGSVLGAFGQYSMLLSDSRDPASMQSNGVAQGGGGFLGTSQLVFWRGQYLVQLNLADESEEPDEAALAGSARDILPALAARVAAAIPGETSAPSEARILPTEGLVWGGATYLANNILGVDQTGAGWVGHYRTANGQRYRVAVLSRGSAEAARAALQRFRGPGPTAVPGVGDEAFTTATFAAARKGSAVVVVAGPAPAELPTLAAGDRSGRLREVVASLP